MSRLIFTIPVDLFKEENPVKWVLRETYTMYHAKKQRAQATYCEVQTQQPDQ